MKFIPAQLVLKTGQTFDGLAPATQKAAFIGEVVFTTGMTGYVETLTDPSYKGQIIVFTYPLIGNYGVPDSRVWESQKIHAAGVVVSEICEKHSHANAVSSLLEWLSAQNIPVITNVDTRAVTKIIRSTGCVNGAIRTDFADVLKLIGDSNQNLVAEVSLTTKKTYGSGKKRIIAVDCGMKENIIRCLKSSPATIVRVPYDYDYSAEEFDGIFLSNGPGDPTDCIQTIAILKKAMLRKKPIFGICLGSQIMALAAGAKTYKLPFGHRGQNQPCQEESTGSCVITSQNHGYAVDEKTLPKGWFVNFRNLNDGSVEGIAHSALPFFSVQFHPEAAPGPTDTHYLFQKFFDLL